VPTEENTYPLKILRTSEILIASSQRHCCSGSRNIYPAKWNGKARSNELLLTMPIPQHALTTVLSYIFCLVR